MSSNVKNHPDPNGRYLGHFMDAIYKQAGEESRAAFRNLQAVKAEAARKANSDSRAIAKKAAQAFQEEAK
jgi:hypothetical protein